MRRDRAAWWLLGGVSALLLLLALCSAPGADADTDIGGPLNPNVNGPSGSGVLVLCPGVGAGVNVLGFGGGYCDYDFQQVQLPGPPGVGTMHVHCEWGGASPIAAGWQCWRVFPGQPDHPRLPDPDIIPDGYGVPWALAGPTPADQWPPLGLAPAPPPGP